MVSNFSAALRACLYRIETRCARWGPYFRFFHPEFVLVLFLWLPARSNRNEFVSHHFSAFSRASLRSWLFCSAAMRLLTARTRALCLGRLVFLRVLGMGHQNEKLSVLFFVRSLQMVSNVRRSSGV